MEFWRTIARSRTTDHHAAFPALSHKKTEAILTAWSRDMAVAQLASHRKRYSKKVIAELNAAGIWDDPIVTEVVPREAFYPAEEYHQEYFRRNSNQAYGRVGIAPKVAKFRKHYLERLKKRSASV